MFCAGTSGLVRVLGVGGGAEGLGLENMQIRFIVCASGWPEASSLGVGWGGVEAAVKIGGVSIL